MHFPTNAATSDFGGAGWSVVDPAIMAAAAELYKEN
jgi:hypothetical protein